MRIRRVYVFYLMTDNYVFSSESVGEGHPDKVADYISDSILDACLEQDKNSRVACETLVKSNCVVIAGEITTKAKLDYEKIVRNAIREIGYVNADDVFHADQIFLTNLLTRQSPDIAQGVDARKARGKKTAEQGAGDQGVVYGYATDETLNYMPLPAELAHRLTYRLEECRRNGLIKGLLPDGKSQVTVQFNGDRFDKILSVLVSAQHEEWKELGELKSEIKAKVIGNVFAEYDMSDVEILVNPSGRFVLGGYEADTGLTGRKLMVDTYGGIAHHGGGAMSGKDASKVDRSGAYLARYLAKNIVAAGLAEKCEVALSYAIGLPTPTSIDINTFFTGAVNERLIEQAVSKVFDLRVGTVIEYLGLKKPVCAGTAVGGHFGKEEYAWEHTDKVQELKNAVMS